MAYSKEYYQKNKERLLAQMRAYRTTHMAEHRDAARRWRAKNPVYASAYQIRNKDRIAARHISKHQQAVQAGDSWHCNKCNADKPASEFWASRATACVACLSAQRRAKRKAQ